MKELFLKRMQEYLGSEYDAYLKTLEEPLYRGLRVNTTKASIQEVLDYNLCNLEPSTICKEAFYMEEDIKRLGNHPGHMAGCFYMQEPSAASAVEVLDVQEGDWVLDLCAAPGGKSTQIAAKLHHTGFLVSNEIESKRAQILLSNMERLGFSECMITNAHPQVLCEEMEGCFDRVLVDAPCSGEGMFKKHAKASEAWSEEHVQACATRQRHILDSAYRALKQDGVLVYSTCTYAMEENEAVIDDFLTTYPDMELCKPTTTFGRAGLPYHDLDSAKLIRIFPMDQGEGHFVAKMQKKSACSKTVVKEIANTILAPYVQAFLKEQINAVPPFHIQLQDKVYVKQTPFIKLNKVKILRQGTLVGEVIKNRLEPHQHFYSSSVYATMFTQRYAMSDDECIQYLKGNLLQVKGYKGYTLVTWREHAIAFAKGDGMVLKNKYPKGMRIKGL